MAALDRWYSALEAEVQLSDTAAAGKQSKPATRKSTSVNVGRRSAPPGSRSILNFFPFASTEASPCKFQISVQRQLFSLMAKESMGFIPRLY